MLQLHRSEINLYHQSFFSPLPSGVVVGSGVALRYRMNQRRGFRLVRSYLCIRDDRATEDSAVFQIINRFIDLLERVSPGHQLI
jgi:hypothetical protein